MDQKLEHESYPNSQWMHTVRDLITDEKKSKWNNTVSSMA